MKQITKYFTAGVALAVFLNLFFYQNITVLAVAVFALGLQLLALWLASRLHKSLLIVLATSAACTYFIATRATEFVQAQSILFVIGSVFTIWYASAGQTAAFETFTQSFFTPIFGVATYIKNLFAQLWPANIAEQFRVITSALSDKAQHTRHTSTGLGILIAIPVGILFLALFAAADPIYYSYLQKIFSPEFLAQIPWRVVYTVVAFLFLLPFFTRKGSLVNVSLGAIAGKISLQREISIVIFVVSVIMASFIIVQWPYVFASVQEEVSLSQFGVKTYAEYVKAGFMELLRASVFVYLLLGIGLTAYRQAHMTNRKLLLLQLVVFAEFGILIASVLRRVYLYMHFHGLTLIRVYGTLFLIFLTCITLTLLGRHLTRKIKFGQIEGLLVVIFVLILGFANVESYIAIHHPPTVNKKVDYTYLSRLSADGYAGWIAAYQDIERTLNKHQNVKNLDSQARAQIAYASYTLKNLFKNYDQLQNAHASSEQYKKYKLDVATHMLATLEKDLATEKAMKPSTATSKETNNNNIAYITTSISQLKEYIKNLSSTEAKNLSLTMELHFAQWPDLPDYVNNSYTGYYTKGFYNLNGVYAYDGYSSSQDKQKLTRNWLDNVYETNIAGSAAFAKMQQDIPLKKLLELQDKYLRLEEQILKQKDRDYPRDVSLLSPLI